MRLKDMKVSSLLKGGIYEVSFGYNPKMGGYTTLRSDIPELCVMPCLSKRYIVKVKNRDDNKYKTT